MPLNDSEPVAPPETLSVDLGWGLPPLWIRGNFGDRSVIGAIREQGAYAPQLLSLLRRVLGEESVTIDIGANIGVVSLWASLLSPRGHVHAIEAIPETYQHLVANIRANGRTNVTAHQMAIADNTGEVVFNYEPTAAGGSFWSSTGVSAGSARIVRATTLDSFVEEQGIERVDVVKIDIEGGELAALAGARRTIIEDKPDLILEVNPIATRLLHGRRWRELLDAVTATYAHVLYVRDDGALIEPLGGDHWERLLAFWCNIDVYCTDRRPRASPNTWPGRQSEQRLIDYARAWKRVNRYRPPRQCYVIEPSLRFACDIRALSGHAGEHRRIALSVQNTSRYWLASSFARHPVLVGYRWLDSDGAVVEDGPSVPLTRPIGPGRRRQLTIEVTLPRSPGDYGLLPTFNQHDVTWLDELVAAEDRFVLPTSVSA